MREYSKWIMQQGQRVEMVIDLHTPVTKYVAARREKNSRFSMSPDGVHLNEEGHRVLADAILTAWNYDIQKPVDAELLKLVSAQQKMMHDSWLSHVGHKRPGVKPGLTLEQARAEAAKIEVQIRRQLKSKRK